MVKNALQAQLLKAGLVNAKQAQKATKQAKHAQKTGQHQQKEIQADIEQAKQQKLAKDQQLNQQKQQQLEEKTLRANIIQMIKQYQIDHINGEISYQFLDHNKIKKIYIHQQIYNALVNGSLVIAVIEENHYQLIPQALAQRIEEKMTGYIIWQKQEQQNDTTDEEDPYAAFVIPDDLMW